MRPEPDSPRAPSAAKTVGAMLLLGVVFGWASIFGIPGLIRFGVSPERANQLPYFAFAVGAAWGFAACVSKGMKELLLSLFALPLTGAVFWFFGLMLGGVLLAFGASEEAADRTALIAFCVGALLGGVATFAGGARAFERLKRWTDPRSIK
jgi:hypothetical protein